MKAALLWRQPHWGLNTLLSSPGSIQVLPPVEFSAQQKYKNDNSSLQFNKEISDT